MSASRPFYRSQDYPECGHGSCRRAPVAGYNPTRRCIDHLREYRSLCGSAASETWAFRAADGPTLVATRDAVAYHASAAALVRKTCKYGMPPGGIPTVGVELQVGPHAAHGSMPGLDVYGQKMRAA